MKWRHLPCQAVSAVRDHDHRRMHSITADPALCLFRGRHFLDYSDPQPRHAASQETVKEARRLTLQPCLSTVNAHFDAPFMHPTSASLSIKNFMRFI